MFSVELKVNGMLVGHAYGVNKGHVDNSIYCKYRWHYYDVAKEAMHNGFIKHDPSKGLEQLVSDILSEVAFSKNKVEF